MCFSGINHGTYPLKVEVPMDRILATLTPTGVALIDYADEVEIIILLQYLVYLVFLGNLRPSWS